LGATGQDAKDAASAVDDLGKELDALFGSLFDLQEAEDASAEAFARLRDRVKEAKDAGDKNAKSLAGQSQMARDNRAAVRNLIKTYFDQIQAYAESGASSDQLKAKTAELRAAFIKQMRQAGFSEAAIRTYAKSFDQVPAAVSTNIKANPAPAKAAINSVKEYLHGLPATVSTTVKANTRPAWANLNDLREILRALPRTKTVNVYVQTHYSGGVPLTQRQHGGPVEAGQAYWVGEQGRPEVFVPDRPGRVYSGAQSLAMFGRPSASYGSAVTTRTAAMPVAPAGGGGGWPGAASPVELARMVAVAVRSELAGMRVEMDGEAVGRIQGRTTFLLGRS
jgi:DNA-binding transcriptional MerR regulator